MSTKNLISAAWACIKAQFNYIKNGKRIETAKIAKRLSICSICVLEEQGRCGDCGCILAEKAKMPDEACPQGFWESGIPKEATKTGNIEVGETPIS